MAAKLNTTYISEALSEKLSHIPAYPITTIVAPIGYGKTRAVSWWAETCRKRLPEALILRQMIVTDSLTDFWRGFCRNLRPWPELCAQMEELGMPAGTPSMGLMLELLSDALEGGRQEIFYIIDDLHFLTSPTLTELLVFLAPRLSARVHLVLLSRNSVFDQADRLHLGARLLELGAESLRLTREGIGEYARRSGLPLRPADEAHLARTTEGWFSMVYLNLRTYLQTGRWPEHVASIYPLIDEVLFRPLSQRQRAFLIRLGLPDDFTAEEAAFLWPEGDAAELLESLTEQNAFITCTDGVYRYHNMLRSCAREKFTLLPDAERRACLLRQGEWYAQAGAFYSAELCYERCGDWPRLLEVFFADQARSITGENEARMLSWYAGCPEEVWKQNPGAMLVMLRKLFSFGRVPEMHRMRSLLLAALEEHPALEPAERDNYLGEAELYMSFLAFNDISAMSAYHRRACALMTRSAAGVSGGNWTFGAPSVLATYHRTPGSLDQENAEMRECMPYFYEVTEGHGNGAEHIMQAETDFYRGRLADAELGCRLAVAAARRREQYCIWLSADFLKAKMALYQGQPAEAEAVLAQQEQQLRQNRRYALLPTLEMCRGWLSALLGQKTEAPQWLLDETQPLPVTRPAAPSAELVRSQLLLARGEWAAAAAREQTVLTACRSYRGMLLCTIWAELQLAAAYEQLGKADAAVRHLSAALEAAVPDGLLLPFVFESNYLTASLSALGKAGGWAAPVGRIQELAGPYQAARARILRERLSGASLTAFGLTERELEIARMAARRRSSREIAESLGISVKSVNNRLNAVYEKLGLGGEGRNKRQALLAFAADETSNGKLG